MGKYIKVTVGKEVREYEPGVTYGQVAREFKENYDHDIILAQKGGKLVELAKEIHNDCQVQFLTTASQSGHKTYERGVTLLMLKGFYDIADKEMLQNVFVKHALGESIYCEAEGVELTEEFLKKLEKGMQGLVSRDIPFEKRSVDTAKAVNLFAKHKMYDKKKLFEYRRVSKVNIYSLGGFEDYYYGYMPESTGILKYFAIEKYEEGF